MATPGAERGQWGSRVGFILAAAGSAVGLGNIWRFPYITGQSGGAAFVVVYLLCVVLICLPYLFAELVLGRHTQKNPLGAIRAIRPGSSWVLVGGLCVLTGVFILSYYSVIAGWTFGYIFKNLLFAHLDFGHFIASPWIVIPLFALFLGLTMLVVFGGVEEGIERWSKVLMPLLILLMIVLIVRSVTLPGAEKGLSFYLKPDFSKVTGEVVVAALGQAFFSLSLGMGAMITYGSYLSRHEDVVVAGSYVALFDTLIALMAGFMIFPAVFCHGTRSGQWPGAGLHRAARDLPGAAAGESDRGPVFPAAVDCCADVHRFAAGSGGRLLCGRAALEPEAVGLGGGRPDVPDRVAVGAVAGHRGGTEQHGLVVRGGRPARTARLPEHHGRHLGQPGTGAGGVADQYLRGVGLGRDRAAEELRQGSRVGPGVVRVWQFFIRYVCPVVIFIILLNVFRGYLAESARCLLPRRGQVGWNPEAGSSSIPCL